MYTHYFQLKQSPFSIAPDPRYLFMSERHREALAHLLYGVGSGGGFVLLTGEIGAGKTTVCRCFMEQIPENCQLAYIFNPKLSVEELLLSICEEFRIALAPGVASVKGYVDAINAHLLASHAQGKNNVLIIDEAQNLSAAVLEQLRLLTNLETSERKLLQIILIGQPELRAMLARPELEQLAQRVIARYHLGSLTADETASYIRHRLAVAGCTAQTPFAPRLMAHIHAMSHGVPRRINLLCDRALLGAYVENQPQVTRQILRRAAEEVFAEEGKPAAGRGLRWPHVAGGVLAGAVVTAALAWHFMPRPPAVPVAPAVAAVVPAASAVAAAAASTPAPAKVPDRNAVLRQLAALWGEQLQAGDACQAGARAGLRCLHSRGGIAELRVLDRPAMLALRDADGAEQLALLTRVQDGSATLMLDGKQQSLPLAQLAQRSDGSFTTFWRAPRGWRDEVPLGARGADVDWLAQRLAQQRGLPAPAANLPLDAEMQSQLRAFQLSQNLRADGLAGPKTYIRLMQLGDNAEPRLSSAAPAVAAPAATAMVAGK
ncbi:putative general secretion pathway protein A [Janthinobacterium sp. HH104]|uniref:General secretion pathway protein A n=2 Tax=Janthinobacterium TaxID=29580 RepID=A0AB38C8M4_9BURK|nr:MULTISPECIES: ExeA family protein [Janthinobacterium]OEZ82428.1 putative general secretion pathway protein A [Janthinobacterium sp. HH104]SFX65756.1 general secretion pathway protein A [Janthinobacterium lividum]